jgi:hypothetical protein
MIVIKGNLKSESYEMWDFVDSHYLNVRVKNFEHSNYTS